METAGTCWAIGSLSVKSPDHQAIVGGPGARRFEAKIAVHVRRIRYYMYTGDETRNK